MAIGASRVGRFEERNGIASVSLQRIAFVFEVFGRSILSTRHANQKSVAARKRFRTWAVGIQGTERQLGLPTSGPLQSET